MITASTDYVITRTHFKELLKELETKKKVIQYINDSYSLMDNVENLIIQEDVYIEKDK